MKIASDIDPRITEAINALIESINDKLLSDPCSNQKRRIRMDINKQ